MSSQNFAIEKNAVYVEIPSLDASPGILEDIERRASFAVLTAEKEITKAQDGERLANSTNHEGGLMLDIALEATGLKAITTIGELVTGRMADVAGKTEAPEKGGRTKIADDNDYSNMGIASVASHVGLFLREQDSGKHTGLVGGAKENKSGAVQKEEVATLTQSVQTNFTLKISNQLALDGVRRAMEHQAVYKPPAPQMPGLTLDLSSGPKFSTSILSEPVSDMASSAVSA